MASRSNAKCGAEAAPEAQSNPLENALVADVMDPVFGPVILVAVAIDGKPPVVAASTRITIQ